MTNLQIVIFGASGDLAGLKLLPGLYSLFSKGRLDRNTEIIGMSRRDWSDDDFHKKMYGQVKKNYKGEFNENIWEEFKRLLTFHTGDFSNQDAFNSLGEKLVNKSEKIFYFSVSPGFYDDIVQGLSNSNCFEQCRLDSAKMVVEKPFGNDTESAKTLDEKFHKVFDESQIYRIDHVLGKDTLLDILSFRENNVIIESLFKKELIDHIQITYTENIGIKDRGKFYEKNGVVRDMVQNHLLQVLAIATMEIPEKKSPEAMSKARYKIINNFEPLEKNNIVLGQYISGFDYFSGKKHISYREEAEVDSNSKVPTYVAFKAIMKDNRLKGIPVYFRTGKGLKQKFTEVTIVFKSKKQDGIPNILSFRIQPQEGIYMNLRKRKWTKEKELENITLDFCYKRSKSHDNDDNELRITDSYENLLAQVIEGDKTYFVDTEEVLGGWKLVDQINNIYEKLDKIDLEFYRFGTWGPSSSSELIERDGRKWYTEKFDLVCRI